jgi:DNA mismatch repair protein MutS
MEDGGRVAFAPREVCAHFVMPTKSLPQAKAGLGILVLVVHCVRRQRRGWPACPGHDEKGRLSVHAHCRFVDFRAPDFVQSVARYDVGFRPPQRPQPAIRFRRRHRAGYTTGMPASRTPKAEGATPAMAQWFAAKEAHPDALVFFRMGDFYELFFSDAEAAAAALDIALTQRGEHNGTPVPMCGVPQHAAEAYLARLIRRGFRVAVAEQMEDPKARTSKAPIRREVVRLITPGTITEEALLEAGRVNLLLALAHDGRAGVGAAWLDVSTGLFETMALPQAELPGLLGRLEPAEILAPGTLPLGDWADRRAPEVPPSPPLVARRRLAETFGVASLDAFGSFADVEAIAAVMAVDYVRTTQAGTLPRLARPAPQGAAGLLGMDAATRASLEIHRARDGGTLHTLLGTVQRTLTPAGARLLAGWLAAPLTDAAAIAARQEAWSWLLAERDAAERLRTALRSAPDIVRALGRLSVNRGGPRDLASLRDGLAAARAAAAALCTPRAHPHPPPTRLAPRRHGRA